MMRHRTLYSWSGLGLLAIAFLAFMLVNSYLLRSWRVDLTEGNLYTVSEGSQNILASIDEPINLYFFYSDKETRGLTSLRDYAQRVRELLEEFEIHAGGKISLHVIDPEPFSEQEDRAAAFGLQGIPLEAGGREIYFGLAGTNAVDSRQVIPFFQPDKEAFLEYDVSKLIYRLANPEKPVIGLLSDLDINGGYDMQTRQPKPAWMVIEQLREDFEIRELEPDMTRIEEDIDLLLVVHPKVIADSAFFAIDQFVLKGGHAVVFVDPFSDRDQPAGMQDPMALPGRSSEMPKLFKAWGVEMPVEKVLADAGAALMVSVGQQVVRHLGLIGLPRELINNEDVVTGGLETVNVSSSGVLQPLEARTTQITPLMHSSEYAMLIDKGRLDFLPNPEALQRDFVPDGQQHIIAARISGKAKSAFPDGFEGAEDPVAEADSINVIVVGDTDILSDRLWVRVEEFFGSRIATPWADNGSFLFNAIDNLSGSEDLIGLRTRGTFHRPFTVVADLKRQAEDRFRDSEKRLTAQLQELESKLSELNQAGDNVIALSEEQRRELERFQKEKLKIRRELRDVQHNLEKDIEQLGTALKVFNIGFVPLLISVIALVVALRRRHGSRALKLAEEGVRT